MLILLDAYPLARLGSFFLLHVLWPDRDPLLLFFFIVIIISFFFLLFGTLGLHGPSYFYELGLLLLWSIVFPYSS